MTCELKSWGSLSLDCLVSTFLVFGFSVLKPSGFVGVVIAVFKHKLLIKPYIILCSEYETKQY